MITNLNSIENFNELVFENRHKAYGAYVIRKSYNSNVAVSLALSIAFFGLLALGAAAGSRIPKQDENKQILIPDTAVIVTPINLTPPDKPKVKIDEPTTTPKIKSDNLSFKVDEHAKLDSSVTTNDVSKIVTGGDVKGKDSVPHTDLPLVTGDKPKETTTTDPVKYVDHMPEFEGDVYKFIRDNIKYPAQAAEDGIGGLVVLSFIVEKDGSIKNISTLKKVPDGCTEEAIRVVNLMPKWKPGSNKGEPMRVVINLPISFTLK